MKQNRYIKPSLKLLHLETNVAMLNGSWDKNDTGGITGPGNQSDFNAKSRNCQAMEDESAW